MKKLVFRPGQFVFKSGEQSTEIFLLVEGEVGIFLPYNETKVPDHKIGVSEIFGEMGLIDDALRMAEARAETNCELISVSRVEFEKKIENTDIIIRSIIATLSQRLRQLEKRTKI